MGIGSLLGMFDDLLISERESVVEWAQRELVLSGKVTKDPGLFRLRGREYMREPLECFGTPGITDVTLMWGAQLAKTTVAHVGALYRYMFEPGAQLHVWPNDDLGKDIAYNRWQEYFRHSPVLMGEIPKNRDDFAKSLMDLRRGIVRFTGAGSVAGLSAHSVRTVICDEVEKYEAVSSKEADPLYLAHQRTKDWGPQGFRAEMCTPTVEGTLFYDRFLEGDQRGCWVLCLHCGEGLQYGIDKNFFVWDPAAQGADGRWNMEHVKRSAHYVCPHCGGDIWDDDKLTMGDTAYWIAENPKAPKYHRSYQLNSFYSPGVTFGQMAVLFLQACRKGALRDFYNGWLGLPWEERVYQLDEMALDRLKANYRTGLCPLEDPVAIGFFADPGLLMSHWVAIAYDARGNLWVFDMGTVLRKEDLLKTARDLTWQTPSGKEVRVDVGLVDSGDWTTAVYDMCYDSQGLLFPSRGSGAAYGSPWGRQALKTHGGIELFLYIDKEAKSALYIEKMAKEEDREKELVAMKEKTKLFIPNDAPGGFLDGLKGQELIRKKVAYKSTLVWKPVANDHYGDCVKLGIVWGWNAEAEGLFAPIDVQG